VGSRKGEKAKLAREMGERGAFAPKLPAKVGRKQPVLVTQELALEMVERFGRGETLSALERDPRFPTRQSFHGFVSRDETLAARWENAKRLHAEALKDSELEIVDADLRGPDGKIDNAAVQQARLRAEVRALRAASLDPQRWGRKTEQTIVGDETRPLTVRRAISPPEVRAEIAKLLDRGDTSPEGLAMKALVHSGKRLPPEIYDVAYSSEDSSSDDR
jgi:hypothetical protein